MENRQKKLDICIKQLKDMGQEWLDFWEAYRRLAWWQAVLVALVYGLRVTQDNIFIDSEIMFLRPEEVCLQWIGSGRFGLAFTRTLFGLGRLVPFLSAALMALMMWLNGVLLSFGMYSWSGHSKRYSRFLYLFPGLFVCAPLFAEQYLFLLQAFEVSFAIGLCIAAAICTGRLVYGEGNGLWLIPGLLFMVWSFGSYQVMCSLYLCLVLISFITGYINGRCGQTWNYGVRHMVIFLAGCLLYVVLAWFIKAFMGVESGYVSSMVYWRSHDIKTCLSYIKEAMVPVVTGQNIYFSRLYVPSALLFLLQTVWYGWKKAGRPWDYAGYLCGGVLLLLSPFFLCFISGGVLPLRTQLVYPVTAAFFLAHLTVLPPKECRQGKWQYPVTSLFSAICVVQMLSFGQASVQLFQTSYEVYREDVMTANRIYGDVCHAVGDKDIRNYQLIFTGGRSAGLAGPAARGELVGLSFFDAEAHTALGVTGRVTSLFMILGLPIGGSDEMFSQYYEKAVSYMEDAPDWPQEGSIRILEEKVVVVRLGNSH